MSKCKVYSTVTKISNSAIIQRNADVKDNTGLQNLKNSSNDHKEKKALTATQAERLITTLNSS